MRQCLFCDSLIRKNQVGFCSHQHKIWFETYKKKLWQMNKIDLDGLRWDTIGRSSSPDAMRQLAGLKPLEIKQASTYNELILCYTT